MSKKMYDLTNPQNLEEVHRLLMAFEENEGDPSDFVDESDIASEDGIEEREDGSETEQEGIEEDGNDSAENNNFYLGKDKVTIWNKIPHQKEVKEPHNINSFLPGVIGKAESAKTPVECWNCFFSDDILNDIVKYTNQCIDVVKESFCRERDTKRTDLIEIRSFVGLLYLAGVYKANKLSLDELWGKEDDGIAKFSLVMSIKRFKLLMRCLRFDDRQTRSARKEQDHLAPIRTVFTKFVNNCKSSYNVGENVTIDEMLPAFRGNCPFRQYIPSKSSKCGIKIYALVDAKIFYSYNLEIYAGKQNEGPFSMSNDASDVVKRLAEPLFGSGRNITADNWFTQVNLINELKQKKLTYVGTVRKNQIELPNEFILTKNRIQNSSIFGYNNDITLVSHVPKKGKNVLLLSSLHNNKSIDSSTDQKQKSEIISFYNSTKLGVDVVDKMIASYNVSRSTKRWPMVIFFTMLNIAGINSQIIHVSNQLEALERKVFIRQLSHELVLGELARRSVKNVGIPLHLQQKLKRYNTTHDQNNQNCGEPQIPPKRRRCETCTLATGLRRLSNYECKKCHNAVCLSHAVFMCVSCYNSEVEGHGFFHQ